MQRMKPYEERTANRNNKYKQTTNENRLVSIFSESYIKLLTEENAQKRLEMFDDLVEDISRRPVEVKPGRKNVRKPPKKKKFCDRRKRALR